MRVRRQITAMLPWMGGVLAVCVISLALTVLLASLVFSGDPTCEGDDPEILMARGLSVERLTMLHRQALALATGDLAYPPISAVFDDLGVAPVRLTLRGCMDHSIALIAYADQPDTPPSEARIELLYAEHPPIRRYY